MDLAVRQANEEDIPTIAEVIASTEAWMRYGIDYDMAGDKLEHMDDTIYVAVDGDVVAGFITLRLDGVGDIGAYVRLVGVAEPYRGQWVGRRMVEYVSAIAFAHTPNLFLICSIQNTSAQRFYERLDFKRVGVLDDLVRKGLDEIFYRKSIGPMRRE